MDARDIFIILQPADEHPNLGPWAGGDLVHHAAAVRAQAIGFFGLYRQAEQWRIGLVRRERARPNAEEDAVLLAKEIYG